MKAQRTQKPTSFPPRQHRSPGHGEAIWENVKTLLIALVLATVIKTSVVEAYKIPSASMEDTLMIGDFLLANKFVYGVQVPLVGWRLPAIHDPEPGDVFIFVYPGPSERPVNYIKRCIAGPGQTVQVIDKVLYVNGVRAQNPALSKYTNPFIKPNIHPHPRGEDWRSGGQPDNFGPYVVPPEHYFAMGDNRDNSSDSRFWGPVPRQNVLGKAMVIHWSWTPDDSSPEIRADDPMSAPRLIVYNIMHFAERVRWNRLFTLIE